MKLFCIALMNTFLSIVMICQCSASEINYQLGSGDKLRISIYHWETISGTYAVGLSDTISIPLVGDITVRGLGTKQVGDIISDRLQKKMSLTDTPSTSVEVVQFRSFYIIGDVEKPGDYPFRPGMVVLNALAIAGGFYRPTEATTRVSRELISSSGDLAGDDTKLISLYLRRSRLQAELEGKLVVVMPAELGKSGDAPSYLKALGEEQTILNNRATAVHQETTALDRLVELLTQEISTRQLQGTAVDEELNGLVAEAKSVRDQVGRGVSTLTRQSTLDVTVADVKRTKYEIQTDILRAKQSISEASQKKDRILSDFRNTVLSDLKDTSAKIDDTANHRETSQRMVRAVSMMSAQARREAPRSSGEGSLFKIIRLGSHGLAEVPANDLDSMEPGDIVKVDAHFEASQNNLN